MTPRLVVMISHRDWNQIGFYADVVERAVHVMACDAKGKPTGAGLRLKGAEMRATLAALEMAMNRAEQKGATDAER